MRSVSERLSFALNRLYPRIVRRAGEQIAGEPPTGSPELLAGRKYCTVVSYRRSGQPIATPVWFGLADGRLYFRSLAGTVKLRRIEHNPTVLVAPCTRRGAPLGPAFRGHARILSPAQADAAERRIQANYATGRRVYEWAIRDADARYVEITPELG